MANTIKCFLIVANVKLIEKFPDEIKKLSASEGISEEEFSAFMKEFLNIIEEVKPMEILNVLENEFRTLIGVEITSKNIKDKNYQIT